MDALQRAQIGNEQDGGVYDGSDPAGNEGEDFGMYNNLGAMAGNYNNISKHQQ